MPVYEYACTACDHHFDKRRPFEEANEPETCPQCGAEARKVLSHFSAFTKLGGGSLSGIKGASG